MNSSRQFEVGITGRNFRAVLVPAWILLACVLVHASPTQPPGDMPSDPAAPIGSGPPTIVLMISDDQHYGDFGFAGNPAAQTPHLDRLAREGALFPLAHVTMSRCRPSLASLLTGLYPHQHGVYYNVGPRLRTRPDTLPRNLKRAGYLCFQTGKFWEKEPWLEGFSHQGERAKTLVREDQKSVRDFLARAEGKPAFIWWAPRLPHRPLNPPEHLFASIDDASIARPSGISDEQWNRWRRKKHTLLAMGAWLDEGVGELLQILGEHHRLQNTLIVFLADNGNDPMLPAKGSAYERGFRTPIILWESQLSHPGRKIDRLVASLDLVPTLLQWAGARNIAGAGGQSLWPLLDNENTPWRDRIFGATYPLTASDPESPRPGTDVQSLFLRTDRWKYITYVREIRAETESGASYFRGSPGPRLLPSGYEQLFDLRADPEELQNLAMRAEHAQLIGRFRREVFRWWSSTGGGRLPIGPADYPVNSETHTGPS